MNAANQKPPANGFTSAIRKVVAVLCLIAFFSLLIVEFVLGLMAKAVPLAIYGALLLCSLMMHDGVDAIMKRLGGKK